MTLWAEGEFGIRVGWEKERERERERESRRRRMMINNRRQELASSAAGSDGLRDLLALTSLRLRLRLRLPSRSLRLLPRAGWRQRRRLPFSSRSALSSRLSDVPRAVAIKTLVTSIVRRLASQARCRLHDHHPPEPSEATIHLCSPGGERCNITNSTPALLASSLAARLRWLPADRYCSGPRAHLRPSAVIRAASSREFCH